MADIKKQLFERLAMVAHCLASPQRIALLDYLAQAERSVEELSQLSGLNFANTSRHLQVLKNHGLVLVKKQGKSRVYEISGEDVILLVRSLRQTAETHIAEMDRLLLDLDANEIFSKQMSRQELLGRLDEKNFVIVDVRPEKEFAQGHIKGAINVSPDQINEAVETLPKGKVVVAYCRGPYCVYSKQLLNALKENGQQSYQLEEGFPEWKAEGFPWMT
ncbi:ArsR/SmtB family transcription factor [Hydrogenovibrio marinus]|uniref:Rhodanese n=1 Tax=Hydrogenovibrio marinus TaxID=28885 RepID=A0A066ZR81_HYDMR|nr:metalloregulator ArsR/SmtB family transcription factor [Hydrogenovibrio marinus]KDN96012.1 rhodanese [Hydrogenovibrio marinus]BBN58493.1 ArsR family transcriptional regulator [Hydrogenovibrio marinus]